MTIETIKQMGKEKSLNNLQYLIQLFHNSNIPIEILREIVSSIGRQKELNIIYQFIYNNVFSQNYMEIVYQMYRTTLYKSDDPRFKELAKKIATHYNNEVINKMTEYYTYKKSIKKRKNIKKHDKALLLQGDNKQTLKTLDEESINLIFTSPPYYNAREYSDYCSYQGYLDEMKKTFQECNRVLESGRFMIVNISPVITKRPGREFESIRYPIHFDFHKILEESGFYFIDEIIWIKPEPSVPNRVGGFLQTKKPLTYKPNCITESILVYRKQAPFLLDQNVKSYKEYSLSILDDKIDRSNCWYIAPKSNKNHPAVFPEKLCEKILNYYSYPNDTVLDPFAGSGTFGKVALEMNRIPILCEQNNNYIKEINKNNLYTIIGGK